MHIPRGMLLCAEMQSACPALCGAFDCLSVLHGHDLRLAMGTSGPVGTHLWDGLVAGGVL